MKSNFIDFEQNHITDEMVEKSYYGDYNNYLEKNYASICGEVALWRAVLLQHLIDLRIKSKKQKYNSAKKEAYKWFMDEENKQDVKKVCEYAGYEYRKVMILAREIIENNDSFRNLKL